MNWFVRILLGMAISALGFFVTWKSTWIVDMAGRSSWADYYLSGFGGTHTLYKLIGILMLFVGFFVIMGLQNDLLGFAAGLVSPRGL